MRRAPALLATVLLCVLALAFGPEGLLVLQLPGGLPLGTLFAILALVAGAAVPLALSRPRSALRWAGALALAVAVLWFPIGVYLAGNIDLNFTNDAADAERFSRLTRAAAVLVLGTMAWAGLAFGWRRQSGSSEAPGEPGR